jgi:hypothetical protein
MPEKSHNYFKDNWIDIGALLVSCVALWLSIKSCNQTEQSLAIQRDGLAIQKSSTDSALMVMRDQINAVRKQVDAIQGQTDAIIGNTKAQEVLAQVQSYKNISDEDRYIIDNKPIIDIISTNCIIDTECIIVNVTIVNKGKKTASKINANVEFANNQNPSIKYSSKLDPISSLKRFTFGFDCLIKSRHIMRLQINWVWVEKSLADSVIFYREIKIDSRNSRYVCQPYQDVEKAAEYWSKNKMDELLQ